MRGNQCTSCAAEMYEGEGQVCGACLNKVSTKETTQPTQGWIPTASRLPTAKDARGHGWIPSAKYIKYDNAWKVCLAAYSTINKANTDCFLPWPPLPEVDR